MELRNILVAFDGSDGAVAALRHAAKLAGDAAHVTALLAHSRHETVDSHAAWVPEQARQIIQNANAEIIAGIEARFGAARDGFGLGDRLHFMKVAGRVDAVLSECARSYDLLIAGREGANESHVTIHPDRIALMSGRPVLIVPAAYDGAARCDHVAVAWDGGRAAARALADGLRLLRPGGQVTLLTVGDVPLPRPVDEVLAQLARHGQDATHRHLPHTQPVAEALLGYCGDASPCLLVMGAYEHSKFREDFLGGITAGVLRETTVPVLLSH